jgi:hypothetical protein
LPQNYWKKIAQDYSKYGKEQIKLRMENDNWQIVKQKKALWILGLRMEE